MLFVTGDTHGNHDFCKLKEFANSNPNLNKNDYLIIAGDFGAIWNEKTLEIDLEPYKKLPFTVLFVDGNHENFNLLNAYPISIWNGGKIHKIADNIIHLMRGQIFNIDNKIIFTFGGAESIDKAYRTENISWWKEEVPTIQEFDEAIANLEKVNYKVDYIITHTIDSFALYYPAMSMYCFNPSFTTQEMIMFEKKITYSHWYFGHYHLDSDINSIKTALYNKIFKL